MFNIVFKFKITIKFYCAAYFQSQTVKFSTFFLFCWSEVDIRGKFYFDSRLGPIGPQDTPHYRFDRFAFLSGKFV